MEKMLKFTLLALVIICSTCSKSNRNQSIEISPLDAKIDSAILLIYKLYSECETSILDNDNGKIDTLVSNISYLCLPVKVETPDVYGDTTLVTIFFYPETGYEVEDPKCDFAYSVGFIGIDSQFDFVVFGDNYYSLSRSQLTTIKPNLDSIFVAKIAKCDCLSSQLIRILNTNQ